MNKGVAAPFVVSVDCVFQKLSQKNQLLQKKTIKFIYHCRFYIICKLKERKNREGVAYVQLSSHILTVAGESSSLVFFTPFSFPFTASWYKNKKNNHLQVSEKKNTKEHASKEIYCIMDFV